MINDTNKGTGRRLKPFLDYLMEKRGLNFYGYHPGMLARRITQRLTATAYSIIKNHNGHISVLINIKLSLIKEHARSG